MMTIVKLNPDTKGEREVEIVDEKGTWQSGSYHIFVTDAVQRDHLSEPHNISGPDFLGEIDVDKEKAIWKYHGEKLEHEEQKQVAAFIIDIYRRMGGINTIFTSLPYQYWQRQFYSIASQSGQSN